MKKKKEKIWEKNNVLEPRLKKCTKNLPKIKILELETNGYHILDLAENKKSFIEDIFLEGSYLNENKERKYTWEKIGEDHEKRSKTKKNDKKDNSKATTGNWTISKRYTY